MKHHLYQVLGVGQPGGFFAGDNRYVNMLNCEFWNGLPGGDIISEFWLSLTNCLLEGSEVWILGGPAHNLFADDAKLHAARGWDWLRNANLYLSRNVQVHDSAFDGTTINLAGNYGAFDNDAYNAYLSGANRLPSDNNDVTVSSFNWQTGPLGTYYLPANSPLVNAGQDLASGIHVHTGYPIGSIEGQNYPSLAYFTTRTDGLPDNAGRVTIGFHYPTLMANDWGNINPLTLYACSGFPLPIYFSSYNSSYDYARVSTPWSHCTNDLWGLPITYLVPTGPTQHGIIQKGAWNGCEYQYTYQSDPYPFVSPPEDFFTYRITDGFLTSPPATVNLWVDNPNLTASWQTAMTGVNQALNLTLCASGTCDQKDHQYYTYNVPATTDRGGTLIGSGPNWTYTPPNATFEGVDTFTFTVSGGGWTSAPATVTLFVVAGPTNFTARCNPNGPGILLNWSLDNAVQQMQDQESNGFYIKDFKIYRAATPGGPYSDPIATITDPYARSYLDVSATPGITYYYVVTFEYQDFYDSCITTTYPTFPPGAGIAPYSEEVHTNACCPPSLGTNGVDVAFIVDNTGSMSGSIAAITNAIASMLDYIICAANNNYRFALVTTDTDGDENNGHDIVDVRVPFTSDINSFLTAITDPNLQGAGGSTPESTDECLNTVVNALTASGRVNTKNCSICSGTQSNPLQIGDFTGFRANAVKLVVLMTDAAPGGFCDCFDCSTDPNRVHQFAVDASNNCIHINAIYMDDGSDPGTDSCTTSVQNIMQDYANTSCGWYEQVSNASSSSDIAVAILNMLYTPGACNCQ